MVRLLAALEKGLMLFNSYLFIFLFLPVALIGYFTLGRRSIWRRWYGWRWRRWSSTP